MSWAVIFHSEFEAEFIALPRAVRVELAASAKALEAHGPMQGRPLVDTLKGSKHPNMKELRFSADGGVWRAAFAFDPEQKAIVLIAGDKSGVSEGRFYRSIIETADTRYDAHLEAVRKRRQKK
jgi:hypothetical protein